MKKSIIIALVLLVVAVGTFAVVKKVSPLSWGWWGDVNTSSGLAIDGYDPVAYFEAGHPEPGVNQHTHEWNGAIWQFSSAYNRDLFAAAPETYAPQFGGYCSFGVYKGVTADASPDAWHIEDGQLYLFADEKVRDQWVDSIESGSVETARENWSKRP